MNMDNTNQDKKVPTFSFLNMSLNFTNQFKAEITCQSSEKIIKKEESFTYQKKSSNQNYNSFTNQILQQKSFSYGLTPKKQPSEEICQYLSDRDFNKNQSLNTAEKPHVNSPKKEAILTQINIRPLETPELEEKIKQKLLQTYSKVKINEQRMSQMRSEQIALQNKQDDKLPKRGLTYISRKLSEILRQKKRIKSSQLFTISFFDEDEDYQNEEINIKTKTSANETQNTGLKCENEPIQLKESKQRRNVRRRIYDSINVMVALGVIKKNKNQYIYIEQKDDLSEVESVIQQEDILLKKKDYLQKLKNDCLYKERCLKYLTQSYSKMKILRKLNTQFEEKIAFNSENTRSSSQGNSIGNEQKIEFPFILMENGDQDMKIQLRNDSDNSQKVRKVNDWTDYIQVSNPNKQSQIDVIRVKGGNLKIITDVDCINLLGSLEINQNALFFNKNQTEILRDYDIINQHKLKKNDQSSRNPSRPYKD